MKTQLPTWAMRPATPEDRELAHRARSRGTMLVEWPDMKILRAWARDHSWPAPRFGFENAFVAKMLETDEAFTEALTDAGVGLRIPQTEYVLSVEELKVLDALYEERSPDGRPTSWGSLVDALREIRRGVEAGVTVKIEGTDTVLATWQGFYEWAHGRYHMLEDGYDKWIGDDR